MSQRGYSFDAQRAHRADDAVNAAHDLGLQAVNPDDPPYGGGAEIVVRGDDALALDGFEEWVLAIGAKRDY